MLISSATFTSVYAGENLKPVVDLKDYKEKEKKAQEALDKMKDIISNAKDQEINHLNTSLVEVGRVKNRGVRLIRNLTENINIVYAPNGNAQTLPEVIIKKFNRIGTLNQGDEADLITEIQKLKPEDCVIETEADGCEKYEPINDRGFVKFCIDNFSQLKKLSSKDIKSLSTKAKDYEGNIVQDQKWKGDFQAVSQNDKIKTFTQMYKKAQEKVAAGDKSPELEQFMIYCEQFMVGNGEAILELLTKYVEERDAQKQEEAFKKLKDAVDTREMKILEEIMNHIQPNKDFSANVNNVVKGMENNQVLKDVVDDLKPALFNQKKDNKRLKEEALAGVVQAQARRAEKRLNDFADKLNLLLNGDKTYKKYLPEKKAEKERKAVEEILVIVNNIKTDEEEINRAIDDGRVTDTETAKVLRESINTTWREVKAKVDALDQTFDKKEGKNGRVKYKKGWQGKLIGMLTLDIPMNIKENASAAAAPVKEKTIDDTPIQELEKFVGGQTVDIKKKDKLMSTIKKVYDLLNHEKIMFEDVKKIKALHDKMEEINFKGKQKNTDDAKKEVIELKEKNIENFQKTLSALYTRVNEDEKKQIETMYNDLMEKEKDTQKKAEYRKKWAEMKQKLELEKQK